MGALSERLGDLKSHADDLVDFSVRAIHLRDRSAIGGAAVLTEPDQREEKYRGA